MHRHRPRAEGHGCGRRVGRDDGRTPRLPPCSRRSGDSRRAPLPRRRTSAPGSTRRPPRSTCGTPSRSRRAPSASRSRARAPTSCRTTRRISRCGRSRCSRRPTGYRFRFTNRIPLERGLGSSAAAIGARPGRRRARRARRPPARSRTCSHSASASRGTSTTSPPCSTVAPASRGTPTASRGHGGSPTTCRPCRSSSSRRRAPRPRRRARRFPSRPPRRRRDERRRGDAARCGDRAGDADCSGTRSATACTSRTAQPARRSSPAPGDSCRTPSESPCTGPDKTVIVWADTADTDRVVTHLTSELGAAARVLPVDVAREGAAAQIR